MPGPKPVLKPGRDDLFPDRTLILSLLDDAFGRIAVARQLMRREPVDEHLRKALDEAGYTIVQKIC